MSGRGGARHHAKPFVDSGILYKCLEKHEGILSDLGGYEHVSITQAPDPKGLVHCMPLWKELVRVEPCGETHGQPLRAAMLSLLTERPELNKSNHSGAVWVNLKLQRLTCLLAHVRKVGRDASCLSPIAAKLNRQEYTMLLDSLKLMELPPLEKGDGAKETAMVVLEKAGSLPTGLEKRSNKGNPPAPALEKAGKNKRMKQRSSDVSMDALGYPVMFASSPEDLGKGPSLGKLPVSKQRPGHRLFAEAEDLQNALGYRPSSSAGPGLEKPKAKAKGKAKAKAKATAKTMAKKPAALEKACRKPWKRLRMTCAKKPERAYLQGSTDGGKLHLIVECSAARCAQYHGVISKIKAALEKDWLTKDEARQLREDLCHKHGC